MSVDQKAEQVALKWLRNNDHRITDNRPVNQDWLFLCLLSSLDRRLLVMEENYAALLERWKAEQAARLVAEREATVLRQYGNKDCTAMADEALAQLAIKEKP